jgi:hypothetical protein
MVGLLVLCGRAEPALAADDLQLDVQLHEVAEDRRPALQRLTRDAARAAEADLQLPLSGTLHVDYVGSPESFRRVLDAHGAQGWPEKWIAGLALLDQDRIIVQVNGPGALHTADTVRHELAHIALHAASQGAWLPRWYHEGVAMFLAGETTLDRLREQAGAEAHGELTGLAALNRGFGNDDQLAAQHAYAMAAGFVRFALHRAGDRRALRDLHQRMRLGQDFDTAWTASFGLAPDKLYEVYVAYVGPHASRWAPLLSDGTLWSVLSLLSVVAMWRAWRRRPRFEPDPDDDEPLDLEAIAAAGEAAKRPWLLRNFDEQPLAPEPDAEPAPAPAPSEPAALPATGLPEVH